MGLDIYVHWSGMTEADREAQITGFMTSPNVGYLRHSWHSVGFCREFAKTQHAPNPILTVYPQWDGSNDDKLNVTAAELMRLKHEKEAMQKWLDSQPEGLDDDTNYFLNCIEETIHFIAFVESKSHEEGLTILYA